VKRNTLSFFNFTSNLRRYTINHLVRAFIKVPFCHEPLNLVALLLNIDRLRQVVRRLLRHLALSRHICFGLVLNKHWLEPGVVIDMFEAGSFNACFGTCYVGANALDYMP
jgi:hypothetical protein